MEKRNFGLDVCRAVAMAMIVMLHVLGQGGLLDAVIPAGRGYWIVWGMETLAFCSVDMFAILSGYLCEGDERFSVYRVMELISIVMFYVIPLFFLFLVLAPETVSSMEAILRALCPPLSRAYWYITCYVPLALLRPYVNRSLRSLSLVQHRNLCVICFVLFMCIPNLMHTDFFRFEYGYSFVWLMVCYVFGAYMKRANVSVKKSCALLLFLTNTVMILLCRLVMSVIFPSGVDYMLTYTSPFVFSMAFFLLQLCSQIHLRRRWVEKVWKTVSSAAFDVYILHTYTLIFNYWFKGRFQWILQLPLVLIPLTVVACVVAIYMVGLLTYFVRQWVYKTLHIQICLRAFSTWMDRYVYYREGQEGLP